MKTICIAGKNDIAVDVMLYCKKYYPQNRVVLVKNRNESGINSWQKSSQWFAEKNSIEIIRLEEAYNIEDLLFLSCEFDRIVKPDKFITDELYNIHFSMLPRYKGCFPSVLPILFGENTTGVTLHRMRAGIDTGEIIEQQPIKINEKDSALDLYKKLIRIGTEVVIRNIDNLLNGVVKAKPQGKEDSSYFSGNYIDFSAVSLEVNKTAFQIQNQIRAFAFRPYQLLKWNGYELVDSEITNDVSTKKAGSILEETNIYIKISTIDYDIILYKDTFAEALKLVSEGKMADELCVSSKIIEAQDEHGWSLLTVAVYNNNGTMARWLIDNGADINIVNKNGTSLLMYAKNCYINTGDSTMFEYLFGLGLDINQTDYCGKSLKEYCDEDGISQIGKIMI